MKVRFYGKHKFWSEAALLYLRRQGFSIVKEDADLGISYLHPRLIRPPFPPMGTINFHTAPLPEMKGRFGINFAILEGWKEWGVSAHFIDEAYDTGPIIEVRRFVLGTTLWTARSLDQRCQIELFQLYIDVVNRLQNGEILASSPQTERGRFITREDFERERRIHPSDTDEMKDRRQRAFYYPPHEGVVP